MIDSDDINFESAEPTSYQLLEIEVDLILTQPRSSQLKDANSFKSADFWLSKAFSLYKGKPQNLLTELI
jgi:hypothetical protein